MKFFQIKFLAPLIAVILLLAAAVAANQLKVFKSDGYLAKTFFNQKTKNIQPAENQEETAELTKTFNLNIVKPIFAAFEKVKTEVVASLSGEKVVLEEVSNLTDFEEKILPNQIFSAEQKEALADDNFFLTNNFLISDQQSGTDDFVDSYKTLGGSQSIAGRQPENSVFITSDYALHLYHLLIDRSFQKIEEDTLKPRLEEMTKVLFGNSLAEYRQAEDGALKDSYKRLAVYYLVPLAILSADSAAEIKQLNQNDFENFAQYFEAQEKQQEEADQERPDILAAFKVLADSELKPEEDWIRSTAEAELNFIDVAETVAFSPLFSAYREEFKNDYTQFTPRSHYTKNKILKTYFMAMIWYGRLGFVLKSDEQTRDALLVNNQINSLNVGAEKLSDLWSDTMALIDFFVGEPDDLTAYEYTAVSKEVFGENYSAADLVDDEKIAEFRVAAVESLATPKILSEVIESDEVLNMTKEELLASTMQFRFMGQRFTPDAYILNQLTQGDELPDKETGQRLPSMATALMPISVIAPDNSLVKNYFDSWVEEEASASDKVIAKNYDRLVGEFNLLPKEQWNENIYWNWLNTYRSLLSSYGEGYPFFMQGENWQKKNLGTVLGSYTELKHDTLLYAKQSYAEFGGGPGEDILPPVVKGYVEADPVFWRRMLSLAKATREGLTERGFMPEEFSSRYDTFIKAVDFFRELSEKELQNEVISDDDFEKLRTITQTNLYRIAEPLSGEVLQLKDRRAGVVADIHTDASSSQILYEGTAKPKLIFVAVSDANGTRLVAGTVFDHYEFTGPLGGNRLSDENWQSIVYDEESEMPEADQWTRDLTK
jgi:hypothetical protein